MQESLKQMADRALQSEDRTARSPRPKQYAVPDAALDKRVTDIMVCPDGKVLVGFEKDGFLTWDAAIEIEVVIPSGE